jgi:hypothetical protein
MSEGRLGLGEQVVGQAVGEPGERVRGERRDDQQIGPLQVRVRIGAALPPREREQRVGADEPLRAARDDGENVVTRFDEQANHLTRLVGGDSTRDAQDHPGHGQIVPVRRRRSECGR